MTGILDRFSLGGRVAVVTGGARGLGSAIARALASAGASVVLTSRDPAAATAAASEIPGRALGIAADVRRPESVRGMIDRTLAEFGRVDILVNNAGTTRRGSLEALTPADWEEVVDTNLKGAWLCCRAARASLRAARAGRIINIASMFAVAGLANRSPYIASKGGMAALTRALAVELAPDGITVNAICPGPFRTDMHDEGARAELLPLIPLGRWGHPEELGAAAVFLASEASSYMTGATLAIDGGYTAR